jgi:hypothetical protein
VNAVEPSFAGTARYQPRAVLGRGGFGVVYEAFDREQGDVVALKTLHQLEPEALLRFKTEFRALSGFGHPNVVALHELTSEGGTWFFTMERVQGVRFLEHVRPGVGRRDLRTYTLSVAPWATPVDDPEPPTRTELGVLDLAALRGALGQLASGVAALHAGGVVHRDLKSPNVMVTPEGRVVILDFGLAAELAAVGVAPGAGRIGTPAYMSPEQAVDGRITEACDWYAVGVMLFEALTGLLPFDGSAGQIVAAKLADDPPDPAMLAAGVPDDLRALCLELLRRDPGLRPTGRDVLSRLGVPGDGLDQPAPFVGRGPELDRLASALRVSRMGTAITLVRGPSGIGKTALVERAIDALRAANPDVVVLQGRCFAQETVPYKALDGIVDDLARVLRASPELGVGESLPALSRVFPVVGAVPDDTPATPRELRRKAAVALRDVLARLANRRPVILLVDDAQWSDQDSASLLDDVLRRPMLRGREQTGTNADAIVGEPPRVLLLATCRTDEGASDGPLAALLRDSPALVDDIVVGGLDDAAARALVGALLPADDPSRMAAILGEAGGHPFFLQGLARRRLDAGATLAELIAARAAGLSPGARNLLELAAVAGQPIPRFVLRSAAGDADQGELSRLVAGLLLRTRPGRDAILVECYHDRVRETVVAALSPEVRRQHHASLVRAMDAAGWGDAEARLVHVLGAGDRDRARELALQAASERTLAFHRAARLFDLAIELGADGAAVHRGHGDALNACGRVLEASVAYERAARRVTDRAAAIDLRRCAAENRLLGGDVRGGVAGLRAVFAELGLWMPASMPGYVASILWSRLHLWWRGLDARPAAADPEALTRLDALLSGAILGNTVPMLGQAVQLRAIAAALDAGEPVRVMRAYVIEALYLATALGDDAGTVRVLERARAYAAQHPDPRVDALVLVGEGMSRHLLGQYPSAVVPLRAADAAMASIPELSAQRSVCSTSYFDGLIHSGAIDAVARELPWRLADAEESGDRHRALHHRFHRATSLMLAADRVDAARADLAAVFPVDTGAFGVYDLMHFLGVVHVELYAGDLATAWDWCERTWKPLQRSPVAYAVLVQVYARFARARVGLALGTPEGLAAARSDVAWLRRKGGAVARPFIDGLAGCLAAADGDDAAPAFSAAEAATAELGFGTMRRCAAYQRAVVCGDDTRRDAIAGEMHGLGIERPDRWVQAHLPLRTRA